MDDNIIPPEFLRTFTRDDWVKLFYVNDGWLNADQCARLWAMTGRSGPPPERLEIEIETASLLEWVKTQGGVH